MAGISAYEANKILEHVFRGETHSGYSTVYVAMLKSSASAAMTGAQVAAIEADYTSYARAAITVGTSAFDAAASGATENSAVITFPACTSGSNTLTHFAILDANNGDSDDNLLFFGALSASASVASPDIPNFPVGELDITLI